uniref:Pentacotripeptide-repeat region of PRORP domain-containing protein n=1 Tax=Anopheles atroparvus TaxID=41427 RepID=A0AAG5DUB0_ANOAO
MDRCFYNLLENVQIANKITRCEVDQLLKKIQEGETVSSAQSLVLVLCCGSLLFEETNESRTALVQEIFKCLENLNIPLDISHYNALLRVYWENEHRFSTTEFLAKLASNGVQPNHFTYQQLLLCSAANGDIKETNNMFECMKKEGLKMNQYVFDLLIITNSKADELELATEIMDETIRAKSKPSNLAFYTLLCGFARKSDIDYLCQIIETCKQKNIIMQEEGFIMILQALADSGHGQHIKRMEKVMHQYGFFMDDLSKIFSLISVTNQFETFNRAEIIDDANFTECKNLAQSLNELIYGSEFASNQRQKMILIILKGFINQGLSISERVEKKLTELIGDTETTHKSLLARLGARNLQSNETPLKGNPPETHLSVKELEEFILEMEGVNMDVKELKLQLIRSVIRSNDHAKVVVLLQKMQDEHFDITPDIYEEIVEMYAMSGQLNEAVEMLKKIRLNHPNFVLNRVKLLRVAKYLFTNNRYGDTLRFLQENVPSGGQKEAKHEQLELDFVYIHVYWEFLLILLEKCDDEQTKQLPFVFAVTLIKEHLLEHNFNQFCNAPRKDSTIRVDQSKQQVNVDSNEHSEGVKKVEDVPSCSANHINLADREKTAVMDSKPLVNTDTDVEIRSKQNLAKEISVSTNTCTTTNSEVSSNYVLCIPQKLNLLEQSKIIDVLVTCKRLSEAKQLVLDILDQQLIPEPLIFQKFLEQVALNGDTDTFDRIGDIIPASLKEDFSFDKHYRSADMARGNVKKHLDEQLRTSRQFKSKKQAQAAAKNFCIVGSCWGLKYQPELDGLLNVVGRNYAKWDVLVPFEVLWQHYLITDNIEKAEEIWEQKLKADNYPVVEIVHVAEENNNESLCRKVLRFFDLKPTDFIDIPQIYDCMTKIMLSKKHVSSVHKTMQKVLKNTLLVKIGFFQWYKSCAELRGLDVPFFWDELYKCVSPIELKLVRQKEEENPE